MIASPAVSHPAISPLPSTLDDLRMHNHPHGIEDGAEAKSSNFTLAVSGIALMVTIVLGAFLVFDPLGMFSAHDAKSVAPITPSSAVLTAPAIPAPVNELIAPQQTLPTPNATKTPAVATPAAQTPRASAPAAPHRAANGAAESRRKTTAKSEAAPIVIPDDKTAPSVLPMNPEVKAEPPAPAPSVNDAVSDAPKPAASIQPPAAKEEVN
ncbi:MAG: hypothetical protein ABI900_10925 [Betaproteobacteria bacterium]